MELYDLGWNPSTQEGVAQTQHCVFDHKLNDATLTIAKLSMADDYLHWTGCRTHRLAEFHG